MPGPMFLPVPIRRSKRCDRCGQRYPARELRCPHCTGLSDREVEALKQRTAEEAVGNADLGRLFLYLALTIGAVIVLGALWS